MTRTTEEQRSTKLAQAREQADKDLAEVVSKLSLEEESSSRTFKEVLEELDIALAAHKKEVGGLQSSGATSSSSDLQSIVGRAEKLRNSLQQSLAGSSKEEAEAGLKKAIEAAEVTKATNEPTELQEALNGLKAAIGDHADAAKGSSILKEARGLRDKLGDLARKAVKEQQKTAQAKQKEAQRKREEACLLYTSPSPRD